MRPIVIELDAVLPGPPALVWQIITDWENQGVWMREASEFVVTSPHREGVGVEATATIRVGGIRTRDRIRVDVWEQQHRLGIQHCGWVKGRGDLTIDGVNGRTRFHWREELHPPWGFPGAIGLRLYSPMLARTFRRDVQLLANLVEKRNVS